MATVTKEQLAELEAKYNKEHGDVIKSLNTITHTMEKVIELRKKVADTKDKARIKTYNAQIKTSMSFLDSCFVSLKQEMWEETEAQINVEEAVVEEEEVKKDE